MTTDPFAAHVKRLREARGLTQDEVAALSGLAADTVRRLEHADFSPSLRTLRKLARAFNMSIGRLFAAFELADDDVLREIVALLSTRSEADLEWLLRFLRDVLASVDDYRRSGSATRGR